MGIINWYIMVDDENYFCGFRDDTCVISTDDEKTFLFDNKEDANRVLQEIQKSYPNAELYISLWGDGD